MAYLYSTELRQQLCVSGSLKEILDGGVLQLYGGTVPVSADSALDSAVLIVEFKTSEDEYLTFEATAPDGILTKSASEMWQGDVLVANVPATFFRYTKPSDTGGQTVDQVRIQGTCGGPAADMVTGTVGFSLNETKVIDYFAMQFPEKG